MVKQITILGSTGSVGRNALRVIDALGPQYQIIALSAHSNVQLLAEQAKRYKPRFVAVTNADYVKRFSELVDDLDIEILAGPDSLIEIVDFEDVDIVLTAVVGTLLLRQQGLSVLRQAQGSLHDNQVPVDSVIHGAFLLVSGALLLTPGFFTDAVGFILLKADRLNIPRVWSLRSV